MLSQWTEANPKSSEQKRKLIEQMFHQEMERVENAWITYELVATRLESQLKKALSEEINELKKHIFKILSNIDHTRNQIPLSRRPRYLKPFSKGISFFKGRRPKRWPPPRVLWRHSRNNRRPAGGLLNSCWQGFDLGTNIFDGPQVLIVRASTPVKRTVRTLTPRH